MNRLTDIYLGSTHSYILKDNLRNPETWSGGSSAHPMFDRGYTGHEHIAGFGLINMNGRCYDPLTSAFLSVDAYVQDPASAQAFNRYAYCSHNPLRFTDPTGWQYGPQSYYVNPNLNPGTHTTYHSDDPNDILWGKTSHPCEASNIYKTNATSTGYSVGNGNFISPTKSGGWYISGNKIHWILNIDTKEEFDRLGINGTYLGSRFLDVENQIYYCIFGDSYNMNSEEGKIVYKLENETWPNYVEYAESLRQFEEEYKNGTRDYWETGPIEKNTDFSGIKSYITVKAGYDDYNRISFEYAGATVYFYVFNEVDAMITHVGTWDYYSSYNSNSDGFGSSREKGGYNMCLYTYGNSPQKNMRQNTYVIKLVFPSKEDREFAGNRIFSVYNTRR